MILVDVVELLGKIQIFGISTGQWQYNKTMIFVFELKIYQRSVEKG